MSTSTPTAYGRIFPPRPDWLAKAPAEDIIDPALPIIDTHHHLWTSFERASPYLLDDILAECATGHHVAATVFVECRANYRQSGPEELRSVGEVEWVTGIAEECARRHPAGPKIAAGIVGYADLTLGDRVEPVLAALAAAGKGRFKGVRNSAGWDADPVIGNNHHGAGPGHYLRPEFQQGARKLGAMGFTLDALVYYHQHADLLALARACPETTIVMNHTGMPLGYGPYTGRLAEVREVWTRHLPAIAACPNVVMKLGGMMMRLAVYDYNTRPTPPDSEELARHWRPWIETAIEHFGARRCTFESNFPVDKMGIGWKALWNAFKRIAANASADEKADLFAGTARRAYRLG